MLADCRPYSYARMSLIRFEEVSLDFGDQKILTESMLAIEPGDRV